MRCFFNYLCMFVKCVRMCVSDFFLGCYACMYHHRHQLHAELFKNNRCMIWCIYILRRDRERKGDKMAVKRQTFTNISSKKTRFKLIVDQ
jgi:hypothetical protein